MRLFSPTQLPQNHLLRRTKDVPLQERKTSHLKMLPRWKHTRANLGTRATRPPLQETRVLRRPTEGPWAAQRRRQKGPPSPGEPPLTAGRRQAFSHGKPAHGPAVLSPASRAGPARARCASLIPPSRRDTPDVRGARRDP